MKRKNRNHGRRLLALALTLVMCLSLLNVTALAVDEELTPGDTGEETLSPEKQKQKDLQIVGGWLQTDDQAKTLGTKTDDGEWNEAAGGRVKVSKTIAPTGTENEFDVTLKVQTTEELQKEIYAPDAAVTLVMDVSASMSQCAICGKGYHEEINHDFVDIGPKEDDVSKELAEQYGGKYDVVAGDGNCDFVTQTWDEGLYGYCGLSADEHQNHAFKERIEAAKESAIAFIDNLRDGTPKDGSNYLAHRWVSLVSFSDTAKTECEWADITTEDGYAKVKTAIEGLEPNFGERPEKTPGMIGEIPEVPEGVNPDKNYRWGEEGSGAGGTNICAGLKAAQDCITVTGSVATDDGETISIQELDNKYTVLLSDGMPSYYMTEEGNTVGQGREDDTKNDENYCTQTIGYADDLKKSTGSALYSISFCEGSKVCYNITVTELLGKMSDLCYSAENADELQKRFEEIGEAITKLLKVLTQAWTVTDPMGKNIELLKVLPNENQDGMSFGSASGPIIWPLWSDASFDTETVGNTTTYTYQLQYKIKLNNLGEDFIENNPYAANDYTKLTYVFRNEDNQFIGEDGKVIDEERPNPYTIGFNVPQVKGYLGDLTFTKTDPHGDPLNGAEFTLTLTGEDGKEWIQTAISSTIDGEEEGEAAANGVVTFSDIPSGHTYTLTETKAPEGYAAIDPLTVTVSYGEVTVNGQDVENGDYTVADPEAIDLTVNKEWDDDGHEDDRPDDIQVQLMRDSAPYGEPVTLNANNWSHTFNNLPKTDPSGAEYSYSVDEVNVPGYTVTYASETGENGDKSITITNTYIETTSLTVNKAWLNNDGTTTAPAGAEVTVTLYRNHEATEQTATLNAENDWTYTFEKLVELDPNGNPYIYTVVETAIAGVTGYTASYSDNVDGVITITNTQNEPGSTSLTVNKTWVNNDDTTTAPEDASVTVTLYRNGAATEQTATLSADNDWTYTFTGLEETDAEGAAYDYTVQETAYNGYTAFYSDNVNGRITITNTQNTPTTPTTPPSTTTTTPSEDIPDDPPPLEDLPDIPDEDPPLSELPDEDVPTTDIPDEDLPLVELPDEELPLEEIPEEIVPLDDVPQTGDDSRMGFWLTMMAGSGMGMAVLSIQNKKREDEEQ